MTIRIPALLGVGPREILRRLLLAVWCVGFFVFLGRVLATGSDLAFMSAVLIVGTVVLSFKPLIGFYACYALLMIVPLTEQRMDLPVFHSPLQAIAFLTIGAALLRFPNSDRRVPRSSIYLPLVVVAAMYLIFALVDHGDYPGTRLYSFVAGVWPLPLIVLLVDSPRQARNVFIGLCATCVALTLLWLPGLLALADSKSGQLGVQIRSGQHLTGFANNPGAASLLGVFGSLGVQTLVALALVAVVLLAVVLSVHGWRFSALFGFATISLTVFTATIASAVATLAVGSVAVLVFYAIPNIETIKAKAQTIVSATALIVLITAVGLSTPPGQHALQRLLHPHNDFSGALRLDSLYTGWHAFLEQPWIGQGAAIIWRVSPEGWQLQGHNTFGVMAYEYGLAMLIPFAWMLIMMWKELWRLLRSATSEQEAGIAAGFLACLTAAIVTGFLTPTFAQIFEDTVIWTLVGLAIVWNNWRKVDPEAVLMA